MPVSLQRDDYPDVKFWEQPLWKKWVEKELERGGFNAGIKGQGVNSSFMEDSDGNHIHPNQQNQILEEVHSCWRTIRSFNINLMTYREMPATVMDYFRAWMESKCPELQLCSSHWKVDEVWRENFLSWKGGTKKSCQVSELKNNTHELPQPGSAELPNRRRIL